MSRETLMEKIEELPEEQIAELERLVDALRSRAQAGVRMADEQARDDLRRARESMRWVREHRSEYAGQWVALDGDRLVASGVDARGVYEQARVEGVAAPFVERVEGEEPEAVWGGWL
jgi:hypothetical protein